MKQAFHAGRILRLMPAMMFAAILTFTPSPAHADSGDTADAHAILSKMRVLAFHASGKKASSGSNRVVLVHLDRKDQMIVSQGEKFEPGDGLVLTVKTINEDGSIFVTGSGITLGRIKVATPVEKQAWLDKLRAGAFDS